MAKPNDRRLVARAVAGRWPVPEDDKPLLYAAAKNFVSIAVQNSDVKGGVSALNVIVGMVGQNQADEHLDARLAAGMDQPPPPPPPAVGQVNVVHVRADDLYARARADPEVFEALLALRDRIGATPGQAAARGAVAGPGASGGTGRATEAAPAPGAAHGPQGAASGRK